MVLTEAVLQLRTGIQDSCHAVRPGDLGAMPQSSNWAPVHALVAQAVAPWKVSKVEPVNEPSPFEMFASADWVKQAVQQL